MGRHNGITIKLKPKERREIEVLLSGGVQGVRTVKRAQVLRQLDEGYTTPEVGERVGLSAKGAWDIAKRYQAKGLEGALWDAPKSGCPPQIEATQKQQIIAMVCARPPSGRARWTLQLIASEAVERKLVAKIGRESVRVLLKSHGLKPWREKNVVRSPAGQRVHRADGRRAEGV